MIALAAACGSPPASPTPSAVKLTIATAAGQADQALYRSAIAAFRQRRPNYEIELTTAPDVLALMQRLQLAATPPPDLIDIGNEWFAPLVAQNRLIDLTPFIQADGEFGPEIFVAGALDPLRFDGRQFGLPRDLNVDVLYYNSDMFDRARQAKPDNTWRWATLLNAAQTLTLRDENTGRTAQYGWSDSGQNVFAWVWQNEGSFFDAERAPSKCTLTSSASSEALQFYLDLSMKHKVAPAAQELRLTPARRLFQSGRLAMLYDTLDARRGFESITTFKWAIAELAMGKKRAATLQENGWAISAGSPRPQEAWRVLRFLAGAEGAAIITGGARTVPALKALGANIPEPVQSTLTYARPLVTSPRLPEMASVFMAEQAAVVAGERELKDALTVICARFDAILAVR